MPIHVVRDVRRRIGLKYLCESDGPFSRRLAPGERSSTANYDEPVSLLWQPDRRFDWTRNMYVVVRQLGHCFHDDREFLHAWNIFNYVKLGPPDSNMPEEMKKQIISSSHAVNVTNWRILCAWISRHHHMA